MDLAINKQTCQGPFSSQKLWAFPDFVAAAPGTAHLLSWAAGRSSHIKLTGLTCSCRQPGGPGGSAHSCARGHIPVHSGTFQLLPPVSNCLLRCGCLNVPTHWKTLANGSRCRDYRRNHWLPKRRSWWWKAWSLLRTKVNELQFHSLFLVESSGSKCSPAGK